MENLLLSNPEYQIEETPLRTWRRFLFASGKSYADFTSHSRIFGLPLIHCTFGLCPETGRRRVAKGVVAIGRVSIGICAIGQAAFGVVAIGQLALGVCFGLGQLATGLVAVGQLCAGAVSIGQLAIGAVAIGQLGIGGYVWAQEGHGIHVWDVRHADPLARGFFKWLWAHRQ